ncbi:MAG: hypothetical protein ACRD1V_10490 [Vicinamibacterales bacterium]
MRSFEIEARSFTIRGSSPPAGLAAGATLAGVWRPNLRAAKGVEGTAVQTASTQLTTATRLTGILATP